MLTRKLEEVSVRAFVISIVSITFLCAELYYGLSDYGQGIVSTTGNIDAISFTDALYFSIVTITTLGYGDFRPVKFGRLVAVSEVIAGVVLIALLISKLASDRTSTYVRLLYTSDSERRLTRFASDIVDRTRLLHIALVDHNHSQKMREIRSIRRLCVGLARYYEYQANVGAIGDDWARKNSLHVIRALIKAATELGVAGKERLVTALERRQIENVLRHIQSTSAMIAAIQVHERFSAINSQIATIIKSYQDHVRTGRFKDAFSEITPYILSQVNNSLPDKPWPHDLHKQVAERLRIPNRFALRIIMEIEGNAPIV